MGKSTSVEQLFEKPPWTPPICYMRPIEPSSFTVNLQKRYKKYFVSNLSGHVMIFIIMSQLFNSIDIRKIILASIIYMVPYNHSIHEIFQASKMMGMNYSYDIKDTDLDNLNKFLNESNLQPLDYDTIYSFYNEIVQRTPVSKKRISRNINTTSINKTKKGGRKIQRKKITSKHRK